MKKTKRLASATWIALALLIGPELQAAKKPKWPLRDGVLVDYSAWQFLKDSSLERGMADAIVGGRRRGGGVKSCAAWEYVIRAAEFTYHSQRTRCSPFDGRPLELIVNDPVKFAINPRWNELLILKGDGKFYWTKITKKVRNPR